MELVIGLIVLVAAAYIIFNKEVTAYLKRKEESKSDQPKTESTVEVKAIDLPPMPSVEIKSEPLVSVVEAPVAEAKPKRARKPKTEKSTPEAKPKAKRKPKMSVAK
jgi:hypothetical protein